MLFSPILRVPAGAAAPAGVNPVGASGSGERRKAHQQGSRPQHAKHTGTPTPTVEVTLELDDADSLAGAAAAEAEALECVSAASPPSNANGQVRVWLKPEKGVPLKELVSRVIAHLTANGYTTRRSEPQPSSGTKTTKSRRRV